jgi:hypothetical protein
MVKMLLEKSDEFLLDSPKKALDVSIMDRRGRNATAIAEGKEHTEIVEVIEEHLEKLHARFEQVKAQLEELKAAGRTDMTMDDFIEKAKAGMDEEEGKGEPEPAEKSGGTTKPGGESAAEKEEAPEDDVKEVTIEEDEDTVGDEGAALSPEEQAMLERLAKKGYTIEKKPKSSTAEVPAEDDAEVQAELNRRAAARKGTGGSANGKPRKTADANVDIELELKRRARAREEL